ncbi:MAG: hypothetical protein Q7R74_01240, partial [bacterium]|nr:hypothetical protein [bacterium]
VKLSNIASETTVSFSFIIHNVEGATTAYPFRAYFIEKNGHRYALANGIQTLDNDAKDRIVIDYSLSQSVLSDGGKVIVELPERGVHIDFILTSDTTQP